MSAALQPRLKVAFPSKKVALMGDRILRYRGRARDRERLHILACEDGTQEELTDAELLEKQQSGELRVMSLREAEALRGQRPLVISDIASPEDLEERAKKLHYVRFWERHGEPPRTPEGVAEVVRLAALAREEKPSETPSPRTVLDWIRLYVNAGRDPDILVPQRALCGNRKERLPPTIIDMIETAITEVYLDDDAPPVSAVHASVLDAVEKYNDALPEAQRLPKPSYGAVKRQILKLNPVIRDFCRKGEQVARQKWRPVGPGMVTVRPNEVWEIDHTTVDAIVVDGESGLPIGRPTVTVAIDRATRAIMGFHIGFDAPGIGPVLDCLRMAILPKDRLLAEHPDIKGAWPCFGVPGTLTTDQAREFKSRTFVEICAELGTDVAYTAILKAWHKAYVERLLGTAARQVFLRVPGTTFGSIQVRKNKAPPEKVAVCTLAELREHFLRWVVEVYMPRVHRTLERSPLEEWTKRVAEHGGIPLPPSPDELARILSPVVWRRIQTYGIVFEKLLYRSTALAALKARVGERTPVKVKVNPLDLTYVNVVDPANGGLVRADLDDAVKARMAGVTLELHKMARAMQEQNPRAFGGGDGVLRAHARLRASMRERLRGNGAANRVKAAAFLDRVMRAAKPEDPPAFDQAASAMPLAPEADGSDEIAEAEAAWAETAERQGEVAAGADEAAADTDDGDGDGDGGGEEPPKPARKRRRKDAPRPAAPAATDDDDEDPAETARRLRLDPMDLG